MIMAKREEWRWVRGLEGVYEVSSQGRVRSVDRVTVSRHPNGKMVPKNRRGRELKLGLDRYGYPRCVLHDGAKQMTRHVHRLVCEAFHGEPPPGKDQVAHADGIRENNNSENLRWANAQENTEDKVGHGRVLKGVMHPRAKLTPVDVVEIRKLRRAGVKYREIAERYDVSIGAVSSIVSAKNWREV